MNHAAPSKPTVARQEQIIDQRAYGLTSRSTRMVSLGR